jgi:Tol biopolymer transport system component
MKKVFCVLLMVLPLLAMSQVGSEIYLLDVQLSGSSITVSNPVNVTRHPGYDNQPSFHTSKPLLFYSSFNDDGRSDIKVYDYKTGKTTSLTSTTEREYSPTLTPDGKFISCIIQRDNDAQDLGKYPLEGGEPITLIDNLIVGYHAWVDENNLILFVLGEPMTVQWYDLKNKTNTVLANNIGRSLHKIPGENAMSFVHKKSANEWVINRLDIASKKITTVTSSLKDSEDITWTNDGRIISSDGEKLFFYNTKAKNGWKEIEMNLGGTKISGITRLAITKDGKKLAIVVSE